MSTDLATLKNELLELDRQLQLAAVHQAGGNDGDTSQSGQLTALKQRLNEQLSTLDSSAWQLLLLEWRYDFALLFDQIRLWMAHVDASFSSEPALKE